MCKSTYFLGFATLQDKNMTFFPIFAAWKKKYF